MTDLGLTNDDKRARDRCLDGDCSANGCRKFARSLKRAPCFYR